MSNVFVSYVHADSTEANRIAEELSKRGANVHLGRDKLDPGIQWQEAIRNIISGGGYFIACFSRAYWKPKRAFLNEELAFAMNELRQCGPDKSFFIPVLLQECEIPIVDIGDDQTFLDLQLIALYDDWDEGLDNIALAISRLTKEDMMQLILENAVKLAAAYDDTKKGVSREIRSNLNAQISAKINDAAFSTGFPQLRQETANLFQPIQEDIFELFAKHDHNNLHYLIEEYDRLRGEFKQRFHLDFNPIKGIREAHEIYGDPTLNLYVEGMHRKAEDEKKNHRNKTALHYIIQVLTGIKASLRAFFSA